MQRAYQSNQTQMETGRGRGNRLMNDALMKLIQDGTVHYDEANPKTLDKEDLAKALWTADSIGIGQSNYGVCFDKYACLRFSKRL